MIFTERQGNIMKPLVPQNILLVIAAVVMVLTAYYNLFARQDFGLVVNYQLPRPPQASAPSQIRAPQSQLPIMYGESWETHWDYIWDDTPVPIEGLLTEEAIILAQFPLDLNSVTHDQLVLIPRIGPVTATRIIQYREHLGGFTHLSQLMDIRGIGDTTFSTISPFLYVRGEGGYWEASQSN